MAALHGPWRPLACVQPSSLSSAVPRHPHTCVFTWPSLCVSAPASLLRTQSPGLATPGGLASAPQHPRHLPHEAGVGCGLSPEQRPQCRDTVQGAVLTQAERAGCSCGHRAGCASATWHHHSPPSTLPVALCAGPSGPSALSWHVPCPERTRWPWLPVLRTVIEELLPNHCLRVPLWAWGVGAVCPLAAVEAERCHCRRG